MNEMPAAIVVRDSLEAISQAAVERLIHLATEAVRLRGVFTLALPGGHTPIPAFRLLATPENQRRLPWASTQVFWGDERCVPPDDPESNYGLAWRELLSHLDPPPAQVHRITGEDPDPPHAAAQYAAELPAALDLLLLGIGEDGHIASLFPGSSTLREDTQRAVAVTDSPKPPRYRITITPPVITAARHILVLAAGEDKAAAVERALSGTWNIAQTPAQLARGGMWFLDAKAAAGLGWE